MHMTIEKLPSGSYRITQMLQGKRYRITIDYRPKKYEAEDLLNDLIYGEGESPPVKDSVAAMADKYIRTCEIEKKSPATIRGYKSIKRNTPQWFLDISFNMLSSEQYRKVVEEYGKTHSHKSTKNFNGFYKRVCADLKHIKSTKVQFPTDTPKFEYKPLTKDVKAILEYAKGSNYECALRLACCGLRRGEIVAITSADLDKDDLLTINKDKVYDGHKYVLKDHPKTQASNRIIKIPHYTAELIRKQGAAYNGFPDNIYRYLVKAQKALDIPRFRLHMLRHYTAAYLHKKGFTDMQVMNYLGWDKIETMQEIYNYNLDPEEMQQPISDVLEEL